MTPKTIGLLACFVVSAIIFPTSSSATTYTPTSTRPTCASMGYVSTAEECVGYTKIRCPFNENAYFCGKSGTTTITGDNFNCADRSGKTEATYCTELGYNKTAAQCASIGYVALPCPFSSTKFYCPNLEAKTCAAGDLLANDLNCYVDIPTGKTIIGVMFTDDLAVDLQWVASATSFSDSCGQYLYTHQNGNPFSYGFTSGMAVSTKVTTNANGVNTHRYYYPYQYTSSSEPENYKQAAVTTSSNMKGKTDTAYWYSHGATNAYQIKACYEKTSPGVAAHSWFAPAVGDLYALSGNLSAVNAGIQKVNNQQEEHYYSHITNNYHTGSGSANTACSVNEMASSTILYAVSALTDSLNGGYYTKIQFAQKHGSSEQTGVKCIISRSHAN